jgi:FixJ family two-component response regulator
VEEARRFFANPLPVLFLAGHGDIPTSVQAVRLGAEDFLTRHVLRGRLNRQIAVGLGIHERTVKLHRTAITSKVGVQSVGALTQLWLEVSLKGSSPVAQRGVVCASRPGARCSLNE